MAKKPLEIDMIAGSQLRDTQGEVLSIEGADISDLVAGKGRLNDNHGKGFFNSIGRVTYAKKIFKLEDCSNDRERYYWEKVKAPFIYARGYLYDDDDHPNARAAAAILRNIHKSDSPLQLKASVEGGVIARGISDPSLLARTKIHSIALTFTPANNNTLVEPLNLDKSAIDHEADMFLINSVKHLAQTNVPSFRHIVRDASATRVQDNLVKIASMLNELGIDRDIRVPPKDLIIKRSIERKIHDNLVKIRDSVRQLSKANNLDSLDKGLKDKVIGAITAATMLSPSKLETSKQPIDVQPDRAATTATHAQQVESKPKPSMSHEEAFKHISKQNPLLAAIAMVESSGGKRLQHKTISNKSSMHHGHTAGGMFGMMPHAAAFIIKRDHKLAEKYPDLAEAAKDVDTHHSKFTERFNQDPQAAIDFAVSMYNRNKGKTVSKEHLAYSWLNGLKGSWEALKRGGHDALANHEYVKRVMSEYEKLAPKRDVSQAKDLSKALVAGYGGAGAPSSMVGGSVVQSESIDGAGGGFKYITCDECGKEQIHSKYQVKCRHCGKNFSFAKLSRVIQGIN